MFGSLVLDLCGNIRIRLARKETPRVSFAGRRELRLPQPTPGSDRDNEQPLNEALFGLQPGLQRVSA